MSSLNIPPVSDRWTADAIRRLPVPQRDAILAAAAEAAAAEYEGDASLTAFNAFGERDLHAEVL